MAVGRSRPLIHHGARAEVLEAVGAPGLAAAALSADILRRRWLHVANFPRAAAEAARGLEERAVSRLAAGVLAAAAGGGIPAADLPLWVIAKQGKSTRRLVDQARSALGHRWAKQVPARMLAGAAAGAAVVRSEPFLVVIEGRSKGSPPVFVDLSSPRQLGAVVGPERALELLLGKPGAEAVSGMLRAAGLPPSAFLLGFQRDVTGEWASLARTTVQASTKLLRPEAAFSRRAAPTTGGLGPPHRHSSDGARRRRWPDGCTCSWRSIQQRRSGPTCCNNVRRREDCSYTCAISRMVLPGGGDEGGRGAHDRAAEHEIHAKSCWNTGTSHLGRTEHILP